MNNALKSFISKSRRRFWLGLVQALAVVVWFIPLASSQAEDGRAEPWQMGLQTPATPLAEQMFSFHNQILLPIIFGIVAFVLLLLAYTCWRFSAKRNPIPSRTTHNIVLESVWVLIPILILLFIWVHSAKTLAMTQYSQQADMTLKIIGNQWYWSYEYPDHNDISFDAMLVEDADLQPGQLRMMTTDNEVVLPVGKVIKLLMTSNDVLHNWALPSLGVRTDTVPGQLNEAWVRIDKPGTYYGFCSELCGAKHAYMPIMVRAVPEPIFDRWVLNNAELPVAALLDTQATKQEN